MDLRFGVEAIPFPHFDFATLVKRRSMRIVQRSIDECKPSLGFIDIMLSWREGNMAQPSIRVFHTDPLPAWLNVQGGAGVS
jgi:hypothetical protein